MIRRAVLIAAVASLAACGVSGFPRPPSALPQARPVAGDPNMVPSLSPGNAPAVAQQLDSQPSAPPDAGVPIPLAPPQVDAGSESH
jgi:hypothetical protein